MTDPLIQKARRVRDEYKEHNKGTIERPVRIDSRTIIYEKVKTDVNAAKFADKIKDIQRSEEIEKRVNKVRNNTAKKELTIKTKFPIKKVRIYDTGKRDVCVELSKTMQVRDIALKLDLNEATVYRHLKKAGTKPPKFIRKPNWKYDKIKELIEQGLSRDQIKIQSQLGKQAYYYINLINK